ncbi:MAG: ATP-dependent Clp protease adaptor ClpS [Bacteroidota bacterium]
MIKEKIKASFKEQENSGTNDLLLFNDDYNSFDFVIESLVDVCEFDSLQAEQCAMIAHYKGKCPLRSGGFDELLPMSKILTEKGLTVQIS